MLKSKHSNFYMTLLLVCVLLLFSIFLVNQVGVLGDAKRVINKGITTEPDPIQEIKVEEKPIIKDPIDVIDEIKGNEFIKTIINEYNQKPPEIALSKEIIVIDILREDISEKLVSIKKSKVINSKTNEVEEKSFCDFSSLGLNVIGGNSGDPKLYTYMISDILPANKFIEKIDIYYFDPTELNLDCYIEPISSVYNKNMIGFGGSKLNKFNPVEYSKDIFPKNKLHFYDVYDYSNISFFNLSISPIEYYPLKNKFNIYNFKIYIFLKDTPNTLSYDLSQLNSVDYENINNKVSSERSYDKFIYKTSSDSKKVFNTYLENLSENSDKSTVSSSINASNNVITQNYLIYGDLFESEINQLSIQYTKKISMSDIINHSWPELIRETPNLIHGGGYDNDPEVCLFFYKYFNRKALDPNAWQFDSYGLDVTYENKTIDPNVYNMPGYVPYMLPPEYAGVLNQNDWLTVSWYGTLNLDVFEDQNYSSLFDSIYNNSQPGGDISSGGCSEISDFGNGFGYWQDHYCHKDTSISIDQNWVIVYGGQNGCDDDDGDGNDNDPFIDPVIPDPKTGNLFSPQEINKKLSDSSKDGDESTHFVCSFVVKNTPNGVGLINQYSNLFSGRNFKTFNVFEVLPPSPEDENSFVPFAPNDLKSYFLNYSENLELTRYSKYVFIPKDYKYVAGHEECVNDAPTMKLFDIYNFISANPDGDLIPINGISSNEVNMHNYNQNLYFGHQNITYLGEIIISRYFNDFGFDYRDLNKDYALVDINQYVSCLDGKWPEDFSSNNEVKVNPGFYYCSRPYFSKSPAEKIRNYILYQNKNKPNYVNINYILIGDSDYDSLFNSAMSYSGNFTDSSTVPLKNLTISSISSKSIETVINSSGNYFRDNIFEYANEIEELDASMYNWNNSVNYWLYKGPIQSRYYTYAIDEPKPPPVSFEIQNRHDNNHSFAAASCLNFGDEKFILKHPEYDILYGPGKQSKFVIDLDRNVTHPDPKTSSLFFPSVYYYRISGDSLELDGSGVGGTNMNLDYCTKVSKPIKIRNELPNGVIENIVGFCNYCEYKQAELKNVIVDANNPNAQPINVVIPIDHIFGSPNVFFEYPNNNNKRFVSNFGGEIKNYVSVIPASTPQDLITHLSNINTYKTEMGLSNKRPIFISHTIRDQAGVFDASDPQNYQFKNDLVKAYTSNSLFRERYFPENNFRKPFIKEFVQEPDPTNLVLESGLNYVGFLQKNNLSNFIFYSGHGLSSQLMDMSFDSTTTPLVIDKPGFFYSSACLTGDYTKPSTNSGLHTPYLGSINFSIENFCHNVSDCSVVERGLFNFAGFTRFIGHTNTSFGAPIAAPAILNLIYDDPNIQDTDISLDVAMSFNLFKFNSSVIENQKANIVLNAYKDFAYYYLPNNDLPTTNILSSANFLPDNSLKDSFLSIINDLYTITHFGYPASEIIKEDFHLNFDRNISSVNRLGAPGTSIDYLVKIKTNKNDDFLEIKPIICTSKPNYSIDNGYFESPYSDNIICSSNLSSTSFQINNVGTNTSVEKVVDQLSRDYNSTNDYHSLFLNYTLVGTHDPNHSIFSWAEVTNSFFEDVFILKDAQNADSITAPNRELSAEILVSIDAFNLKQELEFMRVNMQTNPQNNIDINKAYILFVLKSINTNTLLAFTGEPDCTQTAPNPGCLINDLEHISYPLTKFECGIGEYKYNDAYQMAGLDPKCNDNFYILDDPSENLYALLGIN